MAIPATYEEISVEGLPALAERMQSEGSRFIQLLAVNAESGIDVQYSFMKDGRILNFTIKGVSKNVSIPSITDRFIAAFVFENEIHDLFGVDIRDIAIDFKGNFYALSQREPMTIISPEQKAAREKAARAAAAKAARAKQAQAASASFYSTHPDAKPKVSGLEPSDTQEDIELRLAGGEPEKIARARAAMARKAKAAADQASLSANEVFDAELEAKLANMDPEKAAKVRAAMAKKAKLEDMDPEKAERVRAALANKAKMEAQRASGHQSPQQQAELDAKLSQLDPERAAKVRAALDARARKETAKAEHDEKVAVLEERLKNMDPERAAKVRAAFEAKQRAAGDASASAGNDTVHAEKAGE